MLLNLTEEQITQLAPDAASVKAGKGWRTGLSGYFWSIVTAPSGDTAKEVENALSNSS